jgi:peptidoglycan/LPS O-acetylase OafA/YrhL
VALLSAMQLVSIYAIIIGIIMIGLWSVLIVTNQIRNEEKPYAISFHLAGEFGTAILLIVSGIGLWISAPWAKILAAFSLGMLLYTVIVSPGYYAQLNNLPMVGIFVPMIALTIVAIAVILKCG